MLNLRLLILFSIVLSNSLIIIQLTDEYKGPCGCFGEKPFMVDPVFSKARQVAKSPQPVTTNFKSLPSCIRTY